MTPPAAGSNSPWRTWAYDDFTNLEEQAASGSTAGLTSLAFIGAALRRRLWVWSLTAVLGLLVGVGLVLVLPPVYQASTSVLLMHNHGEDPAQAMQTDLALAQSRAVGQAALNGLGLRQSVASFQATYSVARVTDQVLLITASAHSPSGAIRRADMLSGEFLEFRAVELQTEQQLVLQTLSQQTSMVRAQAATLAAEITQVQAQPASKSQQTKLNGLLTRSRKDGIMLDNLAQQTQENPVDTASMVEGSGVLDGAALVPRSAKRVGVVYAATGLVAGLAVGLGVVVVGALVSDRLRRRDDVARALGGPVDVSVGRVRGGGRRGGLAGAGGGAELRRVVGHLRNAVPAGGGGGGAALGVVAVGDPRVAGLAVASLAVACAREGKRVVVADLCAGGPAARLLGASGSGVRPVSAEGAYLLVVTPERDDVVPVGPLGVGRVQARPAVAGDALAAAWESADLLLTVVSLDPALGGEHLASWCGAAVVVVTAGESTATRVHAVGEMVRLSGVPLVSGVLIGADKTDESLGVLPPPSRQPEQVQPAVAVEPAVAVPSGVASR